MKKFKLLVGALLSAQHNEAFVIGDSSATSFRTIQGTRHRMHKKQQSPSQLKRLCLVRAGSVKLRDKVNDDQADSASTDRMSRRLIIGSVALSALTAVTVAAKLGILHGGLQGSEAYVYSDSMILQDVGATLVTALLAYAFVTLNTYAADKGWLEPRDSRKIIHTFSAPLFMLVWPIFNNSHGSRFFAAIITLVNGMRLYLAGTGDSNETSLAKAVSRSGDTNEALGGPFVYVLMLAAAVLAFWRESPVGIVAMSTLAAGDGMADLIGRRYGKGNQWPGLKKSVAGTIAFWLASTLSSVGLLLWMDHWHCLTPGILPPDLIDLTTRVSIISLVSAILELLPVADDNYTVPFSAALLTILIFQ